MTDTEASQRTQTKCIPDLYQAPPAEFAKGDRVEIIRGGHRFDETGTISYVDHRMDGTVSYTIKKDDGMLGYYDARCLRAVTK